MYFRQPCCVPWDPRYKKIEACSKGYKQRVGLAQALLHDPAVLIMDEPTAGLDPAERKRFLNILSNIGEDVVIKKFEKPKSWLNKKLSGASTNQIDDLLNILEEKSIWQRYGF